MPLINRSVCTAKYTPQATYTPDLLFQTPEKPEHKPYTIRNKQAIRAKLLLLQHLHLREGY